MRDQESELATAKNGHWEEGSAPVINDTYGRSPFGFFPYLDKERFYAWFDINLSEEQSKNYLNYLIDGLFIDQNTEQLTVQLITYNADLQYFGNAILTFNFNKESGGTIRIVSKVQTISIEMYNDDAGKVRGAFEVLYALLVIVGAFLELRELVMTMRNTGSVATYFASGWNYFDILSIALNVVVMISWALTYFFYVSSPLPRQHVLAFLFAV
ncbi:hypothetical protein CYMTET_39787 [Cymbomonas tetramitiformis]|uniref:Polycystin cation channel PKD1/PKD2 domain-containing protein n=1 Tax=Cymbomonas tetramitiformis TaxID=36881 RepID=A0AAE0CB52_9CHLO|nr:hypothetical protein CYMTET_39787 [Cymbomonas tetramitiformis]